MRIDTKNYISYKKIHIICLRQNDNAYKKLNILRKIKNGLREKYKKERFNKRNIFLAVHKQKNIHVYQCFRVVQLKKIYSIYPKMCDTSPSNPSTVKVLIMRYD